MKKMLLIPALAMALIPSLTLAQQEKGNGVGLDVSKFDVAGVKLGMSKDEAIAAIKDKFGFQDGDIEYKESDTKNTAELTVKDKVHNIFIRFNRNINESGELGVLDKLYLAFQQRKCQCIECRSTGKIRRTYTG